MSRAIGLDCVAVGAGGGSDAVRASATTPPALAALNAAFAWRFLALVSLFFASFSDGPSALADCGDRAAPQGGRVTILAWSGGLMA